MELTIGNRTYNTGHLDGFVALHVSRKVWPMMRALQSSMRGLKASDFDAAKADDEKAVDLFNASANQMIEAFSKLPNEDVDYIVGSCLDVCLVKDPTGALSPLRVSGKMMFDDVQMPTMLRLTFLVVKENLGDFFLNPLGAILQLKP